MKGAHSNKNKQSAAAFSLVPEYRKIIQLRSVLPKMAPAGQPKLDSVKLANVYKMAGGLFK